jgi:RND superfamily putative drug exporter
MLSRLATFLHSHGRRVLVVAAVGAVIAGVFGAGVSSHLSPYGANDPATQSVQATDRFQTATHRQIDPSVVALIDARISTVAGRERVAQVEAQLAAQPDVAAVRHDASMVSRDGSKTYVVAYFKPLSDKRLKNTAQQIVDHFAAQHDVLLGGAAVASAQVNTQVSQDLAHGELLAFPFIFLLSLLFFRSLVASVLPPLLGGLAIVSTFLALRIAVGFVDLSVFALNLVTGLGLGLAIDYSLFMVSRYREEAAVHGFGAEALRRTLTTAGRTILFSSLTIAGAIASLAVFPQRFLYSMGIAGALGALISAALALIVLPALLAALGPRVNALAPRRLARAAEREARPTHSGAWYRLAQFVMRRPVRVALASAAVLIALGIPFIGIKFISVDAGVLPTSASARQVQDVLRAQFPAGRTSPIEVVVGAGASSPLTRSLAAQIRELPNVSAIAPALPAGPGTSLLAVASSQPPLSAASQHLVHQIRALHESVYVGVAGETAAFIDLEHSLSAHLPLVLAIVAGATLIVLFLMTGSLILPVKAVLMNALSLSAMFGILVLIFQDGNLQGMLDYHGLGALDATQPVFLFVVGFGLATDYGVFLLSRIKEAHDGGLANRDAVAVGLERTGRIVTAAAVLFAVAIGAFATSQIVFIKELGVGAALVVLIDASVIRALLVPSLMALLGSVNWWAPAPLRWLHARIGLHEGPAPAVGPAAPVI